jgi:hypothetical protein
MALPFERLRAEERLKERSDRLRRRDQWSRCSDRLQFMYRSAVLQDQIRDGLEEALVGGEEGALERLTTAARAAVTGLIELRKQYSLAVKHGDSIVNKLCDDMDEPGLSETEEKRLKALLKEDEDKTNTGGKGKQKAAPKPYDRPATAGDGLVLGSGDWGWSGQGYGGPLYAYSGIQPWGMAPAAPTWGAVQQSGPSDGRAQRVARYPCDNCNEYGHWKYSPECRNYHVHLQQLAAKAVALQGGQKAIMGSSATTTGTGKKSGNTNSKQ